ncbi:MAG TPA: hypothetical protein V6C65_34155 [Allocoleopsis sp.]
MGNRLPGQGKTVDEFIEELLASQGAIIPSVLCWLFSAGCCLWLTPCKFPQSDGGLDACVRYLSVD